MSVVVRADAPTESGAEALAIVIFEDEVSSPSVLKAVEPLVGGHGKGILESAGFKGEAEKVIVHHRAAASPPRRLLFVGAGPKARATEETFRRAAAHATKAAGDVSSLAIVLRKDSVGLEEQAAAVVEGSTLARYRFDRFQTKPKKARAALETLILLVPGAGLVRAAKEGARIGEATSAGAVFARDLANLPGNVCRPKDLAAAAQKMAKEEGLRCEVLDEAAMKRLEMGSLLAVNLGSSAPPRLIVVELGKKRRGTKTVCVIGKGITFDSGGISIKPALDMDKMRYDKSGGCAALGLMLTMARLKPGVHLVAVVPACENMPGNDATRPGDVVRAMNGRTIEILNTDAEGRLILADAFCYARDRFAPDHMIDLATLTGACAATFGPHASGMLGTDESLMRDLSRAGEATYERVWQLPLFEEYEAMVRGSYGDLKNVAGPKAGTITAAAFLKNFVDGTSWVHLDIAGTAYDDPARVYNQGAGATGIGVRLLARFLRDRFHGRGRGRGERRRGTERRGKKR